jgi:hypothetical protein
MWRIRELHTGLWWEKTKGKGALEKLSVGGSIILKQDLKE